MAGKFTAAVDAWVKKSDARMRAVVKESAQRVIAEAQTVGPSVANPSGGEGGKMPVDTGFLRASMAISFDGMPSGAGQGSAKAKYHFDAGSVTLKLSGVELGKTIYAGWTATYASFAEVQYGFMRSAAQNWQGIVSDVVKEAKVRFP
jgi:hypothetical protein